MEVKSKILNLNIKKSSTKGSIPAAILKQCVDIYLLFLTNAINKPFLDNYFPKELKKAEIIPVYKKDYSLKKENYRPVSLLPQVSKIYERLIYKRINSYMCDKLSKYITDFRKCHGKQHSLLVTLEKWKKALDKGENICIIFLNLSKAFDSINYDLLLAKLKAYGYSENALKLRCSYLKYQRQAVQINNRFSSYKKVQAGMPQGFIDRPLLFKLFINDLVLFLLETFLSNYVDDNNSYSIAKELNIIKEKLRKDFKLVTDWFFENYMSLNPTKCQFICLGKTRKTIHLTLEIYLLKIVKKK